MKSTSKNIWITSKSVPLFYKGSWNRHAAKISVKGPQNPICRLWVKTFHFYWNTDGTGKARRTKKYRHFHKGAHLHAFIDFIHGDVFLVSLMPSQYFCWSLERSGEKKRFLPFWALDVISWKGIGIINRLSLSLSHHLDKPIVATRNFLINHLVKPAIVLQALTLFISLKSPQLQYRSNRWMAPPSLNIDWHSGERERGKMHVVHEPCTSGVLFTTPQSEKKNTTKWYMYIYFWIFNIRCLVFVSGRLSHIDVKVCLVDDFWLAVSGRRRERSREFKWRLCAPSPMREHNQLSNHPSIETRAPRVDVWLAGSRFLFLWLSLHVNLMAGVTRVLSSVTGQVLNRMNRTKGSARIKLQFFNITDSRTDMEVREFNSFCFFLLLKLKQPNKKLHHVRQSPWWVVLAHANTTLAASAVYFLADLESLE